MATLATVHNCSICVFPMLGTIQLNNCCLSLSRMLRMLQKENKSSSAMPYGETVEEFKQKFFLDFGIMCLLFKNFFSFHLGCLETEREPTTEVFSL